MKFPFQDPIFAGLPQAFLVGGSVRDMIRDVKPLDFDVVVPGDPLLFARMMADKLNGKVVTLGKDSFSVHRVVSKNLSIDVTAFKGDDIKEDLLARDFTINAIACDLASGEIIDCFGGVADLRSRRIKMVSPDAFSDDPARLIRAFRMAATLNFQITPHTFQAIADQADAIRQVAGERIWAELELIMACPNSRSTLNRMAESQLLFHLIPELRSLMGCEQNRYHEADVFTHTLQAYRALEELLSDPQHVVPPSAVEWVTKMPMSDHVMIKIAVLLHDTGKPEARSVGENGSVHFYGHAARGAVLSRSIGQRLRIPNRHQDRIEPIIRYHQRPLSLFLARGRSGLRPKAVGRFFRQCADLTPYILLHTIADDMGKGVQRKDQRQDRIAFYRGLMARYFEAALKKKESGTLVNGQDLIEIFGIQPSPLFGKILKSVAELQMAGALSDRGQAIRWVADFLDQ